MTTSWKSFLLQKSNIVRVFQVSTGQKAPARTFRAFDDYPATSYMYELDQQYRRNIYPAGIFRNIPLAKMLENNPPIFFQKNIDGIIAIAQSNQMQILLATFAFNQQDPNYVTAIPAYQAAIAAQNQLLVEIAQNDQVLLYDFAAAFPQDTTLYADAIHVNAKGSAFEASLFADFIIQHFFQLNDNQTSD